MLSDAKPLPMLREAWLFLLAALGAFGIAVPRVCREVMLIGDSAELVTAAHVWGVPRPSGYPLWTLLGHVASTLPLGTVAFRVNLTSALFNAVAIGLVALIAQRLSRSLAGGIAAALSLALSKSCLIGSSFAEVEPLDHLFVALGLWLALRVQDASPERRRVPLLMVCGWFALYLAHHEASLLIVPAVLVWVGRPFVHGLRTNRRFAAEAGAALFLPWLVCELLLFLAARRGPLVAAGDGTTLEGLSRLLARSDYGGWFGAVRLGSVEPAAERVGAVSLLLFESLGPLPLVLAVVGAFALLPKRRRASVVLLLAFVVPGPVFAALSRLGVEGESSLTLLERATAASQLSLVILCGVGVAALFERFRGSLPRAGVLSLVAAVVPALPLMARVADVDPSRDHYGGAFTRDLFRAVPTGSLVLVTGDPYQGATQYACIVEARCAGIDVVAPGLLSQPWRRAEFTRRHPGVHLPGGRMVLARSHELVAEALPTRAVYVVPPLLGRDPELARRFVVLPELLLARLHADADGAKVGAAHFLELAREMTSGKSCEGCALDPKTVLRPSEHVQILMTYSATLENTSRLAFRLGSHELATQLEIEFRALDAVVGAHFTTPAAAVAEPR
ncbi:MAG: DUF2723 domain-containing protein [Myxococcales bacterium]|nr:DUF2723 domain-containing protein [Myxococcales bacterium]